MTEYFVDATGGSDGNDGLSSGAAWQTVGKINAATFNAGDVVNFKRGEFFRGELLPGQSGVSGNPITFQDYGSGLLPVFDNHQLIASAWTAAGSEWWVSLTSVPLQVWADDVQLTLGSGVGSLNVDEWFHDGGANKLYVRTASAPSGLKIEWINGSFYQGSIRSQGKSWLVFKNLHGKGVYNGAGSSSRGITNSDGSDNVIDGCEASYDKSGTFASELAFGVLNHNHPNPTIKNCSIHDVNDGIQIEGVSSGHAGFVTDNTIFDLTKGNPNTSEGIKINDDQDFTGLIISGNDISGYQQDGIDVFGGSNMTIEDNIIHSPGTLHTVTIGIKHGPLGSGAIIRYNTIIDAGKGVPTGRGIILHSECECYRNIIINALTEAVRDNAGNALTDVHDNTDIVHVTLRPGAEVVAALTTLGMNGVMLRDNAPTYESASHDVAILELANGDLFCRFMTPSARDAMTAFFDSTGIARTDLPTGIEVVATPSTISWR